MSKSSILDEIVATKRAHLANREPLSLSLQPNTLPTPSSPPNFVAAFQKNPTPIKLMLEIKPKSPSVGVLANTLDLPGLLNHYHRYATAISVLTDEPYFNGSLALLQTVSSQSPQPTLCKDFILDPRQVVDARQAGASAVLLIVKILTDIELQHLHQTILDSGMTPLVEIQNDAELDRAMAVSPQALLINNRNLETMAMDLSTTERLAPLIPNTILTLSASGIEGPAEIQRLAPYASNFLVGSHPMRVFAQDPQQLPPFLQSLLEGGPHE